MKRYFAWIILPLVFTLNLTLACAKEVKAPNMDSLIAVGSLAALLYGVAALFRMAWGMGHGDWEVVRLYSENLYFESAAMILTLITLGKYLETRAKGRTGDAIRALMDLSPKTATVNRNGETLEIPVEQVAVGDTVIVRSGGRDRKSVV